MINGITCQAIEDALKEYGGKGSANKYLEDKEAHPEFVFKVEDCWWTILMAEVGWQYKERALKLWKLFHPEHFGQSGEWLDEDDDSKFDLDVRLSGIAVRTMQRYINAHEDKQLNVVGIYAYLAKSREPQQLRLF